MKLDDVVLFKTIKYKYLPTEKEIFARFSSLHAKEIPNTNVIRFIDCSFKTNIDDLWGKEGEQFEISLDGKRPLVCKLTRIFEEVSLTKVSKDIFPQLEVEIQTN